MVIILIPVDLDSVFLQLCVHLMGEEEAKDLGFGGLSVVVI